MTLIGYYNRNGYAIECVDGVTVYSAGNHRQDSTFYADPGTPECLTLKEIKLCCRASLDALCSELNATNGGIETDETEP